MDLNSKKKIAFICSGGAVKAAAFHMGVALSLERVGFNFVGGSRESQPDQAPSNPSRSIRVYVGASAGCLVATFLAQGGKLSELVSAYRRDKTIEGIAGLKYRQMFSSRLTPASAFMNFDPFFWKLFGSKKSLSSPFNTNGIKEYLNSQVISHDNFSDLEADLFIVATKLNDLQKVIFGRFKSAPLVNYLEYRNDVAISDACAASMSLPPIYHPYTIQLNGESHEFFDGEVREPLNAHIGRDIDCDLVICSYTYQPLRLTRPQDSLSKRGMFAVTLQAVYQSLEEKIQVARGTRKKEKALLDFVHRFFKEKGLDPKLEDELCEELEARMTYKSHIDYIYIHPKTSDLDMFAMPHFSLNREHTEDIVKKGYLAGVSAMKGLNLKSQLD
jgi:predicted acylesterase/phospholipase RssA